jgi:hypothetical protein
MAHTAYIQLPVWARWLQRILFGGFYSLVFATGLRAVQLSGPAMADATGWWGVLTAGLLGVSGWVMVGAALVCIGGVASKFYNVEMIGLYLACAGLCGGAIWLASGSAWYTLYTVLAVVCGLGLRLLQLALIAQQARAERYFTPGL